jgi:hypothetical protein
MKDNLYNVSCALAFVQAQIDDLGIDVGECPLLDKVYEQLSQLEDEIDSHLETL